jgi:ferrous iron transport protein B
MNSARWTWFAIGYQTVFAYVLALVYYQLGTLFTTGIFTAGTIFGILALVGLLYMIFRSQKDYRKPVASAAVAK